MKTYTVFLMSRSIYGGYAEVSAIPLSTIVGHSPASALKTAKTIFPEHARNLAVA